MIFIVWGAKKNISGEFKEEMKFNKSLSQNHWIPLLLYKICETQSSLIQMGLIISKISKS